MATSNPVDEYFVKLVESVWGVQESIDGAVQRDRVMHVIKLMRHRLTTISNNNQEEYVLRDIFRTYDVD